MLVCIRIKNVFLPFGRVYQLLTPYAEAMELQR